VSEREAARQSFGRTAEIYERSRPSYPDDAVDWVAARLALGPSATVLDLGAGTGKLSRLLVPTGARVIAVEPQEAMRAQAAVFGGVETMSGSAEDIPLGDHSVDAVTVAQAFHWFRLPEAVHEIDRVLRPAGRLALVWNLWDIEQPLSMELGDLLEAVPRENSRDASIGEFGWREPLEATGLFEEVETARFPNSQTLDVHGLVERVSSISFVAVLDQAERDELLGRVRALAERRGGRVTTTYVTEVMVFARRGES
jgi:SAM-dependent methyltransferase